MTTHLTVLASLAVAILLSPETLILGLIMACNKRAPRLAAWMYAVGAAVGLTFGLGLGFMIAPTAPTDAKEAAPTWTEFGVRAVIAVVLIAIGVQRSLNAMRGAPIKEVELQQAPAKKPDHGIVARTKAWFSARFGGHMGDKLPPWRVGLRSALLGFATMGIHPKCVSVAIAAGHQALQITDDAQRTIGIAVFAVISMLPSIAPAVIETVHAGGSAAIKESCERFLKTNGRWVSAALLLGAGAFVAWNAWKNMP